MRRPAAAGFGAIACLVVACGDNRGGPAFVPPTLSGGPVAIDTATGTLSIAGQSIDHFLRIGTDPALDATHFYDARGDAKVTFADAGAGVATDGEWTVLASGARVKVGACAAIDRCAAIDIDASGVANAVMMQLALPHAAGEPLFGTGDAPIAPDVAGTVRELQFRIDDSTASGLNEAHVPIPLVLAPASGFGMLVADDRPGALDLAAADPARITATMDLPARGTYRVYVFARSAPLDLVRAYVALSGKPAVPPKWAFAPQQWRNEWANDAEVVGDADAMRTRHIPGSVMWIDNPWETAYNTQQIDTARFADPAQLFADLTARGYKVMFWSTPYVGTTGLTQPDHADGAAHHYFVTTDGGGTLDYPWNYGPGALVDFTAPGAAAWWQGKLAGIVGAGASGFKLDFAEDVVTDVGGNIVGMEQVAGDNSVMHRRYAAGYHAAYLGALPPGDGFLITRAGAWGEQTTNTAIWPGDLECDFTPFGTINGDGKAAVGGLPTAIARGLSLSVSGYPFYGSDIGGFRGFPTTEALVRWAEYAAFGTIMQLGGGGKSHDPWDATLFDAGTDATYQQYAAQHMLLVPLLWTLARAAGDDGTPVTRPARFIYPDSAVDDAMFLLGDDLLIAPVIDAGATTRTIVLPAGRWRDLVHGGYLDGDGHTARVVDAPLAVIPRFQRAGSLVPQYAQLADTLLPATAAGVTSYTAAGLGDELRAVYASGGDAQTTLYDGTTVAVSGTTLAATLGSEIHAVTFSWDPRDESGALASPTLSLPLVAAAALPTCAAPGCYSIAADQIQVRLVGSGSVALH